jgi:hypothetical protein
MQRLGFVGQPQAVLAVPALAGPVADILATVVDRDPIYTIEAPGVTTPGA